jgi:thiol-disulfide isomerase/thioredoxin
MTRIQKLGTAALCMALAVTAVVPPLLRAQTGPAPAKAAARTPEKIFDDIKALDADATKIMPSLTSLADPDFRKADGQKVLPILKKMIPLWEELGNAVEGKDEKADIRGSRYHSMAFVAALGDKETSDKLAETAKGKDDEAVAARSALIFADWVTHSKDAAAQTKLLDEMAPFIKAHAEDEEVLGVVATLSNLGPASNDVTKQLIEVLRKNATGKLATNLVTELDQRQEVMAMIGKPLAVSGRTSTGGTFSSTDYKGKVVLLDFWATWCGPCVAGMPEVKEIYGDLHSKGLEIVGISCDEGDQELVDFVAKNQVPWVQLRESTQNARESQHPLAKKYHVDAIPTMFLIDRKGNLRYIDAREDMRKKIEGLLAETADAGGAPVAK